MNKPLDFKKGKQRIADRELLAPMAEFINVEVDELVRSVEKVRTLEGAEVDRNLPILKVKIGTLVEPDTLTLL